MREIRLNWFDNAVLMFREIPYPIWLIPGYFVYLSYPTTLIYLVIFGGIIIPLAEVYPSMRGLKVL